MPSNKLPHKEVALRPSRGALTDIAPQDVKEAYKRKEFRLLDILASIREGKLPSNDELRHWIKKWQGAIASISNRDALSSDGRVLLHDVEHLLESLTRMVQEKNRGEKLQQFLFHSWLAGKGSDISVPGGISNEAKKGIDGVSTVARLFITSSNFRDLISDVADTFRDVYGVGKSMHEHGEFDENPKQQQQFSSYNDESQYYQSSSQQQQQQHSSQIRQQQSSRPQYSSYRNDYNSSYSTVNRDSRNDSDYNQQRRSNYSTDHYNYNDDTYYQQRRNDYGYRNNDDDYGSLPQRRYNNEAYNSTPRRQVFRENTFGRYGSPIGGSYTTDSIPTTSRYTTNEAPYIVQEPPSPAHATFTRYTSQQTDRNNSDDDQQQQPESSTGRHVAVRAQRAKQLVQTLPDLMRNIDPEKKERLINRIKAQLRELNQNNEFQDGVHYIADAARQLLQKGKSSYSTSRVDANVFHASLELKHIIEDFASGHSLDPLLDAVFSLYEVMNSDMYIRDYMSEVRSFLRRAIREPAYLDSNAFSDRLSVLMDRGRSLFRENYREQTDRLLDELDEFMNAVENDELSTALARDITNVSRSLFYSDNNQMTFKSDLLNDFRRVFLPAMLSQIQYIAIPRVEHRDANYDIILDNIILSSKNLMPNVFEIRMDNSAVISPYDSIEDKFSHRFTINAFQIQADVHDVSFYFRKKTGLLRLKDHGVADFQILGNGITVYMTIEYDRWCEDRTLIPRIVDVVLDDVHLHIHHSQHDGLYKIATPMIVGAFKKAVRTRVQRELLDYIRAIDERITVAKREYTGKDKMSLQRTFTQQFIPGFMRRQNHGHGKNKTNTSFFGLNGNRRSNDSEDYEDEESGTGRNTSQRRGGRSTTHRAIGLVSSILGNNNSNSNNRRDDESTRSLREDSARSTSNYNTQSRPLSQSFSRSNNNSRTSLLRNNTTYSQAHNNRNSESANNDYSTPLPLARGGSSSSPLTRSHTFSD